MAALKSSSQFGEASMGSLILGYIASMGTILIVLMVLLNNYLQHSSPKTAQQPLPVIGRVAAPEHQAEQLLATPGAADVLPSNDAPRIRATDATVSESKVNSLASANGTNNAQTPVIAETTPKVPENGEIPIAAPPAAAKIKPQKSASRHIVRRHNERPYEPALGFYPEPPYRQTYGPFSRGGTRF